jgi:hypothetical protein
MHPGIDLDQQISQFNAREPFADDVSQFLGARGSVLGL